MFQTFLMVQGVRGWRVGLRERGGGGLWTLDRVDRMSSDSISLIHKPLTEV